MSVSSFNNTIYRSHERVQWTIIEGEATLVDLERDTYYILNVAGTVVWEVIVRGEPLDSAVSVICARFDVTRQVAFADITALVNRLIQEELICRE
jgi:hypothetical protein